MEIVDFKLDYEGVGEILISDEVADMIEETVSALAPTAEGYVHQTFKGKVRVNGRISAVTGSAIQDNLDNNTLLKCLKGGS